ncbi:hypothetical protein PTKIN_Ptkin05aG0186200 [Pterospermum kingtungense]
MHRVFFELNASGSIKLPKEKEFEAKDIHMKDNKLSDLRAAITERARSKTRLRQEKKTELTELQTESPDYASYIACYLSHDLAAIPPLVFQHILLLQVLDLSDTNIKLLPKSLPKLVALRKLFLRRCKLFMELPPLIGKLENLEEPDLAETQIMDLPREIGGLAKLRHLRVSLYGHANHSGDIPIEIKGVLRYSTSFFLDNHATALNLSEFGIENMKRLNFCLLAECNKIETIIDGKSHNKGDEKVDPSSAEHVLESLQYLGIHYMKNLRSIWRGPTPYGSLSKLKLLALHTCPRLSSIFSHALLESLVNLEELILEDCPQITSLVSPASIKRMWDDFLLPSLKRLLLVYSLLLSHDFNYFLKAKFSSLPKAHSPLSGP